MHVNPQKLRQLRCPSAREIADAYSDLATNGQIELTCALVDLPDVLHSMETTGYVCIIIAAAGSMRRGIVISGLKSESGPCFDSGRTATYTGGALAALDDDQHLFFGDTAVCEKTARLMCHPAYSRFVRVSKGDPELRAQPGTNPAPHDCDTFDSDCARLADSLDGSVLTETGSRTVVLYPGPFRALVLDDGSLVRRGKIYSLAKSAARRLIRSDGFLPVEPDLVKDAPPPPDFWALYRESGSRCMVDLRDAPMQSSERNPLWLDSLDQAPSALRERLRKVIDGRSEYFVMTGSDTRDLDGCCPSDSVTAANRLVEAGVLQVSRSGDPGAGCPAHVYAFRGEMRADGAAPQFEIDEDFRTQVSQRLQNPQSAHRSVVHLAVRWVLLLFVAISAGAILANIARESTIAASSFTEDTLLQELALPYDTGVAVLLFHRTPRCALCNALESHARNSLERGYSGGRVVALRLVEMDRPAVRDFVQEKGLVTSTIVLIGVRDGRIVDWRVFTEGWQLTDDFPAFSTNLRGAIVAMDAGLQ